MSAWANRRAAVQAEADRLDAARQEALLASEHAALAKKPEAEVLAELDLPNPDDMQAGDDFSAFMKSSVPAALRNRALKQLWASNPALANVDKLVDYGDDFTGKNDPVALIKTVYRVGKGMLADKEDTPEAAIAPEAAEESADDRVEISVQADEAEPAAPAQEEQPAHSPRRRMRFEFGEGERPAPTGMGKQ